MGLFEFVKSESILLVFTTLFFILLILYPSKTFNCLYLVDWKTIITFVGLLVITTGLKESGYFIFFLKNLLTKIKTERSLAFFMVSFTLLVSTFLTNDVTILIVIPLTISLQHLIKNKVNKLLILETISANVGSSLTPIGNPQNIFLWHKWSISFIGFISEMFPMFIFLTFVLLIFILCIFSKKELEITKIGDNKKKDETLLVVSSILLIIYVFCLEKSFSESILGLILLFIFFVFLIFYRDTLLKVDWIFVLLLTIIFIDFYILSHVQFIQKIMYSLNLESDARTFLFSILASQILSNVPATILFSSFTHDWKALAYGVNVGGNGLFISSLANLVSLRMIKDKKIWINFHKYTIIYLILTAITIYFLLHSI